MKLVGAARGKTEEDARLGIPTTGTLGILRDAATLNLVDLAAAFRQTA
jgi:hypothetical protein